MATPGTHNNPEVFIVADNILSPIGRTTQQNFEALKNNISGVKQHQLPYAKEHITAALFENNDELLLIDKNYTKFENLLVSSISNIFEENKTIIGDEKTVLLISTTKGNISLLESELFTEELKNRISLGTSAKLVANYFGFKNPPIVISNACISGVMAILTGMRLIRSGQYNHAVIAGADVVSQFVLSGFQSFHALSNTVCKPFDKARNGLNLGEGAATVILSTRQKNTDDIKVVSGAISNDANHISGPSRTGYELGDAIKKSLTDAHLTPQDIDYISAHGTATPYNDEMEANALHYAGLQNASTNSLKAYYGHTLGAAGLIESVVAVHSMKESLIIPSAGYQENGVSQPINICTTLQNKTIKYALKTASGFGGCNAAVIFSK